MSPDFRRTLLSESERRNAFLLQWQSRGRAAQEAAQERGYGTIG